MYLDEPEDRYRPREEPIDRYGSRNDEPIDRYRARDEERYEPEPPPRRVVPASRRPVQQPGEPLDVEPLQRRQDEPRREVEESRDDSLDDPW